MLTGQMARSVTVLTLVAWRVAGDCRSDCHQLVSELPQALDCRSYRMMLPRPKVGKACTSAYDDGATTACVAICEQATVPSRDGKATDFCRKYLQDYPKPTVHKSCRTGYGLGFDKGLEAGRSLEVAAETPVEVTVEASPPTEEEQEPSVAVDEEEAPQRRLLVSMPVTVDDAEVHLEIFEGDDAVERVSAFCADNMADSVDSCVRQLTPHVERKLAAV